MKKWVSLLLMLCVLLSVALGEESVAVTETAEEEESISLTDVRYYFEHRLLPHDLYENADRLIPFLQQNGVAALWTNFTLNNDLDPVYTKDQFGTREFPQADGTTILLLTLPMPEVTPLCCRVYLCWNEQTGKAAYYTVEYDDNFGEKWFLCGWSQDGTHLNYGVIDTIQDCNDPEYENALAAELSKILELLNSDT